MKRHQRPGPGGLSAVEATRAVADGTASAGALVAEARARCAAATGGEVVATMAPEVGDGPLAGAVLGVKDLIDVAGEPSLRGLPAVGRVEPATEDAEVVRRLRAAGAAVVARLQLHPIALGVTGGDVRNPVSGDRIPGGSSSGSAAAVAAGLVHGALGTDTGGSVRVPAACCGLAGLKPTLGGVSTRGVHPLAWSLDTVGPLAVDAADVAMIWRATAGHDPADPVSEQAAATPEGLPGASAPDPAAITVLGIPRGLVASEEIAQLFARFTSQIEAAGIVVVDVDLPAMAGAHAAGGEVISTEGAAVWEEVLAADDTVFPDNVRTRLARGLTLRALDVARARRQGRVLRAELHRALGDVDALVLPTMPCRTPRVGATEVDAGDGEPYPVTPTLTRFTNPWNLAGVPAGTVPMGRDSDGAPVGVQVVAGAWQEPTVLAAMAALEALPLVDA